MTVHRIEYVGPSALAVETATKLADADGIELKASQPPERRDEHDSVVLALTVEGDIDDVLDAVAQIRADLPAEASIQLVG